MTPCRSTVWPVIRRKRRSVGYARSSVARSSPRSGSSLPTRASQTSVNGGIRSDSQDMPDSASSRSVRRLVAATGTRSSRSVSGRWRARTGRRRAGGPPDQLARSPRRPPRRCRRGGSGPRVGRGHHRRDAASAASSVSGCLRSATASSAPVATRSAAEAGSRTMARTGRPSARSSRTTRLPTVRSRPRRESRWSPQVVRRAFSSTAGRAVHRFPRALAPETPAGRRSRRVDHLRSRRPRRTDRRRLSDRRRPPGARPELALPRGRARHRRPRRRRAGLLRGQDPPRCRLRPSGRGGHRGQAAPAAHAGPALAGRARRARARTALRRRRRARARPTGPPLVTHLRAAFL